MRRVLQPWFVLGMVIVFGFAPVAWGQTFSAMQQAYWQAGSGTDQGNTVIRNWLASAPIETMTDVDQLTWLARWMVPRGVASDKFLVQWTGKITAATEGTYTFSTSPYNVNVAEDGQVIRQTMAVWIGNQQVLDTTQGQWNYRGTPVRLAAGTATPIRVEFSYSATGDRKIFLQPAFAQLRWEGPGVPQDIVPSSVLSTASGMAGLDAVYRVTVNGQEQVSQFVEPKVDQFWHPDDPVVPEAPALRQRLGARLGTMVVDPSYLNSCQDKTRPLIIAEVRLLDSAGRRAVFESLMARPAILLSQKPDTIRQLCELCRTSAPDQVLEVCGLFTQANLSPELNFTTRYGHGNYQRFGRMLAQNPAQMATLEQKYLALSDGRCSLSVAYSLCYAYGILGRMDEWVEKLQARLDDASLTGNTRVNWLIARAQAEEHRTTQPGMARWAQANCMAGQGWLYEACLVAQSEPVRLRTYKELAVRLASQEDIDGANSMLDKAAKSCKSDTSVATLSVWRTKVSVIAAEFQQEHAAQELLAQKAYMDSLKAQRQQAIDQHDDETAAHYEQLLSTAGQATGN